MESSTVPATDVTDLRSTANISLFDTPSDASGFQSLASCQLYTFLVQSVFQWIVMVGGILGNCLTCAIVWDDIRKSTMPLLMVNLAIADNLLLLLVCNLIAIPGYCGFMGGCAEYRRVSAAVGTVLWSMVSVVHMMTIWSIVAITFARFVSVCWATSASQYNSRRKVQIRILIMHVSCIIFNIPRYFEAYVSYDATGKMIAIERKYAANPIFYYTYKVFLYYALYYVIPLSLLIYFTIRLCISLRDLRARTEEMTSVSHDKMDLTFSLVIVVVVFIVCQMMNPIRRLLLIGYPLPSQRTCGTVFFYYSPITTLLVTFNSASNFFIFCLCARRFRARLKALFWKSVRVFPVFTVADSASVGNEAATTVTPGSQKRNE